jgi:hypothetical protein
MDLSLEGKAALVTGAVTGIVRGDRETIAVDGGYHNN